jgi:hypothetical protein
MLVIGLLSGFEVLLDTVSGDMRTRCIRINAADEDRKQWAHLTEKYGLEF